MYENKIYFIGLFIDARVRNKNTDLIFLCCFLFNYIRNKNMWTPNKMNLVYLFIH
jgi:hypothetical protein